MVITQCVLIVDHIVDFLFLVPLSGRREGNGGDVQTTLPAWNRAGNPSSLFHVGISRAEVVWDVNECWWNHVSQFWHCLGQSGPATSLCEVGNGVSKGLLELLMEGINLLCHDIFSDGRFVIWNSWWQQLGLGERCFLLFIRILAGRLIVTTLFWLLYSNNTVIITRGWEMLLSRRWKERLGQKERRSMMVPLLVIGWWSFCYMIEYIVTRVHCWSDWNYSEESCLFVA